MVPIREYYVVEKECKHSVRYTPRSKNSPLAGMSIYVPRSVLKSDPPPKQLLLSVEVSIEADPEVEPAKEEA